MYFWAKRNPDRVEKKISEGIINFLSCFCLTRSRILGATTTSDIKTTNSIVGKIRFLLAILILSIKTWDPVNPGIKIINQNIANKADVKNMAR